MVIVPETVRNTCLNFATDAFCSDAILESRLLHQDHYTEGWMSEKCKITMWMARTAFVKRIQTSSAAGTSYKLVDISIWKETVMKCFVKENNNKP